MSDVNELQLEKSKNIQSLKYENQLSDISTTDYSGFISDNLLVHESSLDSLRSTFNEELDEVAYFSRIKAKQRIYDENDTDRHSAEYTKGQKAIELMTDKESHRKMNKRENKMSESSKRLNLASEAALAIKKKYANPSNEKDHFKELRARVKDSLSMYENIHSADRYFAEAVAKNKTDEEKLKSRADINYYTKLFHFFLREINIATDPAEKEYLINRQKVVMDTLRKVRSNAERKFGLFFTTNISLNKNETIDDSKEFYEKEKEDINTVNSEIENSIEQFNNKEEINKESKVGDWGSSSDFKEILGLEIKRSEVGEDEEALKIIEEQKSLLKENLALTAISDKYAKNLSKEDENLSKESPENHITLIKGTATFTRYVKQKENEYREKFQNQLKLLDLGNDFMFYEDNKNSKIKAEDMGIYHLLRQYELTRDKQETAQKFKNNINSDPLSEIYDITFTDLLTDIERIEKTETSKLVRLENSIAEQYKIVNKIDTKESVDFKKAYSFFKNSVKINDVSLEKYDADKKKEEELKYYKALGYTGFSEKSQELILMGKNSDSLYKERYFQKGSLAEKKYTKEFESLFKPIMLGDNGEVLEKYKENDTYNKNLVEIILESDIDVIERKEILTDLIDRALAFDIDGNVFTLKYITESEENFTDYIKTKDFFRNFEAVVLKDPVNMLIIRTDEGDLNQKIDRLRTISQLVNAQANIINLDLQKNYSIDELFNVLPTLSQADYEDRIKEWNKVFNEKREELNGKK